MKKTNNSASALFAVKPYALIICEEGSCHYSKDNDNGPSDYAEALNKELASFFDTADVIRCGTDVWAYLTNRIPDVIIFSDTLPNTDPITLVRSLRRSRYCIDIRCFLLCEKRTESIKRICDNYCIDDVIINSDPIEVSANKIISAYTEYQNNKEDTLLSNLHNLTDDIVFFNDGLLDKRIIKNIQKTVIEPIGINPNHKGSYYIQTIICMKVLGIQGSLKSLYEATAEFNKTTPSAVEKAVRYSIEKAMEKSTPYVQYYLFGNTIDASRGKPTNAEFIETMVQHVKDSLKNAVYLT